MDIKRKLRAFLASFLLTCIGMGAATGFVLVERSGRAYHRAPAEALLFVRRTAPLQAELGVLGFRLELPMQSFNSAVGFAHRHSPFFLPARVRLVGQLGVLGVRNRQQWQSWQRERDYRQILLEESSTPTQKKGE